MVARRIALLLASCLAALDCGGSATPSPSPAARRLALSGTLALSGDISGVQVLLDGRTIVYKGAYSYCFPRTMPYPTVRFDADVEPGRHVLTLTFTPTDFLDFACPAEGQSAYVDVASSYQLFDRDTGEILGTIALGPRTIIGSRTTPVVTWSIDV